MEPFQKPVKHFGVLELSVLLNLHRSLVAQQPSPKGPSNSIVYTFGAQIPTMYPNALELRRPGMIDRDPSCGV